MLHSFHIAQSLNSRYDFCRLTTNTTRMLIRLWFCGVYGLDTALVSLRNFQLTSVVHASNSFKKFYKLPCQLLASTGKRLDASEEPLCLIEFEFWVLILHCF